MSEKNKNMADGMSSNEPIDLSKVPFAFYQALWSRIRHGTSPGTFWTIGVRLSGVTLFIVAVCVAIPKLFSAEPLIEKHPAQTIDVVPAPEKPDVSLPDPEKSRLVDENAELKRKIDDLQVRLNKKPDWQTCQRYISELAERKNTKALYDQTVLNHLNPPLTLEQAAQGMYYTVDALDVLAKQAAEYRKMASDVQQEIVAIEVNRGACE